MFRHRVFVAAGAVAAVVLLAACGGGGGGGGGAASIGIPQPTATPLQSVTIPLALASDGEPLVSVSIGGGPAQTMPFDTGSAGLRIMQSALAGAVYTDTGTAISNTFGNPTETFALVGTVGMAPITIGGVAIGKPVSFQIVKSVQCLTGAACNPATILATYPGIFGVRPRIANDGVLYGPMSELPGNLGGGFIVSLSGTSPHVQAGLTSANTAGFAMYPVPTATLADGAPIWNQSAAGGAFPWCYTVTVGTSIAGPSCATGVVTDSVAAPTALYLGTAPPASIAPAALAALPLGAQVTATLGTIGWTLPAAGTCLGYNEVDAWFGGSGTLPPVGATTTNGEAAFLTNDVLYDLRGGNFGFRAVTAGPPSFC